VKKLFENHRVFLVGGPGGVGKTTLSAALGVAAVRAGYKTLVLTVDPAQRLAQALGLGKFSQSVEEVSIDGFPLHVSQLNTQRYLDTLIARLARSSQQYERILANPLYKTMVENLSGTTEYAAMECLYEFSKNDEYEKIIVDTPPTQNAVDLLSAPQRLADFMDTSVLRWFSRGHSLAFHVFHGGTKLVLKALRRIFGPEFFDAFEDFLSALDGLEAGFRVRNLEVLTLLRSEQCAFLLVTRANEARFLESVAFQEVLKNERISLRALFLNGLEADPGETPVKAAQDGKDTLLDPVKRWWEYRHSLWREQALWAEMFETTFEKIIVKKVPRTAEPPHTLAALARLGEALTGTQTGGVY
jgi:anion-transporting  ArsA/GET3 family ATPase